MSAKDAKPRVEDAAASPAPIDVMSLGDIVVDKQTERSYVKKLDYYLLPFLSLMYFFNSVDRSNLGNAQTDGLGADLGFVGNQYSLLILLFYIPNGLCDLPLNMLTKKFSGRVMLPGLMFAWGAMALVQNAAKNFAGLAFSGLISFGVFQIKNTALQGWQWLFIIEGALTVIISLIGFWWLPASSSSAWFLTESEREVARLRSLRDASRKVDTEFDLRECFQTWSDWKFPTARADIPHCIFLVLSFIGLIILATVDGLTHRGVAYFACFLVASGAYIPSCLVHSWHNNNNLNENSRAANTGLLVGLGNLGGILSAATFRTEYAPRI
ncbi:hypothetical protein TruAng_002298 [Truncatella angustata]|nr:hypothetical protein TruAng_002298 [Truncatella angustata]